MSTSNASIGVRLPDPLKQDWIKRAKQEHRSLSNWVVQMVEAGKTFKGPVQRAPGRKTG